MFSWKLYSIERRGEEIINKIMVVITTEKIKKVSMIRSALKGDSRQYQVQGNF